MMNKFLDTGLPYTNVPSFRDSSDLVSNRGMGVVSSDLSSASVVVSPCWPLYYDYQ